MYFRHLFQQFRLPKTNVYLIPTPSKYSTRFFRIILPGLLMTCFCLLFFCILELPWDEPTTGCGEFVKWKSDNSWMTISPWKKLETLVLSMLRKILDPDPDKRITMPNIIDHKWCKTKNLPLGMYAVVGRLFCFVNKQPFRKRFVLACRRSLGV